MTRSQKTVKNVFFSTGAYMLQLLLSMIVRVFFVHDIGREYLGLNSVYASVMSMISIADLGLDTVFVYLLYRPLRGNDYPAIRGVLHLYRQIYRVIAAVIALIGVVLLPFIPQILGGRVSLKGTYVIFVLYVINAVVGYLNAYKRSLLIADQNSYIVNGVSSGILMLVDAAQIVFIVITPDPVGYMVIQVAGTVLTNLIITGIAKRRYTRVFREAHYVIDNQQKRTLWQNGIGGVSNKIGGIVVVSSDNILLAMFTNLVTVGMYSNYTVLTTALTNLMQTVSTAVTPSIGQLGVTSDRQHLKTIFLELSFIIYTLAGFIFCAFYGWISPFVLLWVGASNVFAPLLTWLVATNLWLNLIRVPSWMFADSFGLQWVQRWKAVVEAIVNLGLSLLFLVVFKWGIAGVLLGTILSTILIVLWYEPWTIFNHVIPGMTLGKYARFNLPFLGLFLLASGLYTLNLHYFPVKTMWLQNAAGATGILAVLVIGFLIIFRNNVYFKRMLDRCRHSLSRQKN